MSLRSFILLSTALLTPQHNSIANLYRSPLECERLIGTINLFMMHLYN